ncbi:VOC family protein [Jatrophihabitans sp. DSM 45814]
MPSPLKAADLYHTGFMVPDLPAAMQRMTALAGYRFTVPIDGKIPIWTVAGEMMLEVRFVYSIDAPHIELIQQLPGTPWMPAPGNAAHHLGYFADDLAATADRMIEAGFEMEACGIVDGKKPAAFAFLKDAAGLRIEIVDRAGMPDWPGMIRNLTPTESQ